MSPVGRRTPDLMIGGDQIDLCRLAGLCRRHRMYLLTGALFSSSARRCSCGPESAGCRSSPPPMGPFRVIAAAAVLAVVSSGMVIWPSAEGRTETQPPDSERADHVRQEPGRGVPGDRKLRRVAGVPARPGPSTPHPGHRRRTARTTFSWVQQAKRDHLDFVPQDGESRRRGPNSTCCSEEIAAIRYWRVVDRKIVPGMKSEWVHCWEVRPWLDEMPPPTLLAELLIGGTRSTRCPKRLPARSPRLFG